MKLNKYWFVPKKYGYGFMPISWEGWVSVLVMLLFVLGSAYVNNIFTGVITDKDLISFVIETFLIIGVSTFFMEKKTKGKLEWKWGDDKE